MPRAQGKHLYILIVLVFFMIVIYHIWPNTDSKIFTRKQEFKLDGSYIVSKNKNIVRNKFDEDVTTAVDAAKKIQSLHGGRYVMLALINDAFLSFTYSWLCNTKHMGIHDRILFIATDAETKNNLTRAWKDISVVHVSGLDMKGDQKYTHVGYVRLVILRSQLILSLLQAGIDVFLFETDAIWLKYPVLSFLDEDDSKKYDLIAVPVSDRKNMIGIGFLYVFASPGSKKLWNALVSKLGNLDERLKKLPPNSEIPEGDNDQIYLSDLARSKQSGVRIKDLKISEYPDGKWYTYDEPKRKTFHPVIINNNWVIGNPGKIKRAKRWGHWFINKDWTCNMKLVNDLKV